MKNNKNLGIGLAILAASLYALNAPFSKILLKYLPPTLMAGFLYLGAGLGMLFVYFFRKTNIKSSKEESLTRKELPYTLAMVVLDIIAPIFLLVGLSKTSAANASLLNNFEIVATALIALMLFKEQISKRLLLGIGFVTVSCSLLTIYDFSSIEFSFGSIFVLLAATCWGLENNCTRKLSSKDPLEIVFIKGIFSGLGSLIVGLILGEKIEVSIYLVFVILLGFIAYGLSIYFYVYAQRFIGAARTSAYYAVAPFISAVLSLLVFKQIPSANYIFTLLLMIIGAFLSSSDKPIFKRARIKV